MLTRSFEPRLEKGVARDGFRDDLQPDGGSPSLLPGLSCISGPVFTVQVTGYYRASGVIPGELRRGRTPDLLELTAPLPRGFEAPKAVAELQS